MIMKKILFFALVLFSISSYGQTITSGGDWSDATIWQGGIIGNDITDEISSNNNIGPVSVDQDYQVGRTDLGNGGELITESNILFEIGDDADQDDSNGISAPRNLTTNNDAIIRVQSNGTMIIYGDLVVNNNAILDIQGTFIVKGDIVMNNGGALTVTGDMQVNGDFVGNNNTAVEVNSPGSVNIDGNFRVGNGSTLTGDGNMSVGTCDGNNPDGVCEADPLPIELKSFTASKSGNNISLDWITAKEENFSHFEVERSLDQENWEQIGLVQGTGESMSDVHYDFTDRNAPFGVIYYRLNAVDIDASFEYSPVVKVEVGFEGKLAVSPNPVKDAASLKIQVPGEFREDLAYVGLFDLSGVKVQEFRNFNIDGSLQINQKLKSGMYILKVNHNGLKENIRVIIQ